MLLSLQFSGLQIMGSVTQHSLLQLLLRPVACYGRVRKGKLWEGKWKRPDSLALFSAWQWQLLDHSCHTSVFHFCPGHWVQLQYMLTTQAGMLILPFRPSGLQNVHSLIWFLPSLRNPQWALGWGLDHGTHLCSSLFPPSLFLPIHPSSDVSTLGLWHVCLLSRKSSAEL